MTLLSTLCRIVTTVLLFAFIQKQVTGFKTPCQTLGGKCFPKGSTNGLKCTNATGCSEDEICCLDSATREVPTLMCPTSYCCLSAGGVCLNPWVAYDDDDNEEVPDYNYCFLEIPGLCGVHCICCLSGDYYDDYE